MQGAEEDVIIGKIATGEREYTRAVAYLIAHAEKDIRIFDADLSRGNFNTSQIVDLLQQFLAGGRHHRLQIVVHDTAYYYQQCVRLSKLHTLYAHQMEIRVTDARAHVAQDAMVIADAQHYLHRFHINQARFRLVMQDGVNTRPLLERFDELVEAAPTLLATSTLGL